MSVKITSFEAENVKRVKAVSMEPTQNGLTIIGGRNGQGKTSVLDAIAWTLGGNRNKPSNPKREGAAGDPYLKVELSNGIVVERKGKNSTLKVIDPNGGKSGQELLDAFLAQLALDLPKFMHQTDKEKADTLLNIIGVGDKLAELDTTIDQLYNQRQTLGQLERQKRGAAEEMQQYPEAPNELVSAADLINQQQEILAHNGENQRKRQQLAEIQQNQRITGQQLDALDTQIKDLQAKHTELLSRMNQLNIDEATASKTVAQLQDESTSELEESIRNIDAINIKVRSNAARARAFAEADEIKEQYTDLTNQINDTREQRAALLDSADLPLPGLSVENGFLVYNGQRWDGMSGAEQLKVGTSIVRKLNPECGFVLVDKLEQMDAQTLNEYAAWCEAEQLQVIGTRVSTGDECSIIIEDGKNIADVAPVTTATTAMASAPVTQPTAAPVIDAPKWTIPTITPGA